MTWGVWAFSTLDYLMLHNKVCSLKMLLFPLLRSLLHFAVDETIRYLQCSDVYSKTCPIFKDHSDVIELYLSTSLFVIIFSYESTSNLRTKIK